MIDTNQRHAEIVDARPGDSTFRRVIPMIIAVFRSYISELNRAEFDSLYTEMSGIVARIPGYLSHKTFTAHDGELALVVEFESKEALEAWDEHPDHKRAKELGKMRLLDSYNVAVAEVFERHVKSAKTHA